MAIQLFLGYIGEGTTDSRFISEIINKTFAELAYECHGDMNIDDVRCLSKRESRFTDLVLAAAKESFDFGLSVLCVHADADHKSARETYQHKISPMMQALDNCSDSTHCKNIVVIIPITETESWMLADKELLKKRINATSKSDNDLEINKSPEEFTDPKAVISNAIRIAQQGRTKRHRRDLTIADLYGELGQLITIEKLRAIPSFREFEAGARESLVRLGYIQPPISKQVLL